MGRCICVLVTSREMWIALRLQVVLQLTNRGAGLSFENTHWWNPWSFLHRPGFSASSHRILLSSYLVHIMSEICSWSNVKIHYDDEEENARGGSDLIQATGQGRIVHHHVQEPSNPAKSDQNFDFSPTLVSIPAAFPPFEHRGYNHPYSISRRSGLHLIRITYGTALVLIHVATINLEIILGRIITQSHSTHSTHICPLRTLNIWVRSSFSWC